MADRRECSLMGDALMQYIAELNAGEAKPRWEAQEGSGTAAGAATIASTWSEADR